MVAVTAIVRRTSRGVRDARVMSDPCRSLRFDCAQSSPCGLLLWLVWRRPASSLQRLRRPSSPACATPSSRTKKLGYRRPPLRCGLTGAGRPSVA